MRVVWIVMFLVCTVWVRGTDHVVFPLGRATVWEQALDAANLFPSSLDTLVRQNEQYIYVADRQHGRIHILDMKTFQVVGYFGHKGQGPLEVQYIHDLQATRSRVYVLDGLQRKVLVFGTKGKFIRLISLEGSAQRLAVDEQNHRIILNAAAQDANIFVVHLDSGKLLSYGALPKLGNELLDARYFSIGIPIAAGQHLWIARSHYPDVIALNRRTLKPEQDMVTIPAYFHGMFRQINAALKDGLKDGHGMPTFATAVIRDGRNVLVCSANYATRIDVTHRDYHNFLFATRKEDGGIRFDAFSLFFLRDNVLYAMKDEAWFKYSLETERE